MSQPALEDFSNRHRLLDSSTVSLLSAGLADFPIPAGGGRPVDRRRTDSGVDVPRLCESGAQVEFETFVNASD